MADLSLLRALAKRIFLLLALISPACLGDGCSSDPIIVKSPSSASILQGSNHTCWCKGIGSHIDWEINGIPVYKLSEDLMLQVVSMGMPATGDCTQESTITVHAKSVPEHNTLSTFAIQCVVKKAYHAAVISEASLEVHVIGEASDVELISPKSSNGPAIIQWKAPDVLSGSSSPLYYNITVRDPSNQLIAQNTTTDTSFAIDSDLLAPCHSYEATLLPFQQISSDNELGITTQMAKNYSGTPLPATDVKFSVSMEPDAASVTITFKVILTSCSLQWPEKYTVTVMQQGTKVDEIFQSAEQTVQGLENEYTLEELDLRQRYQVLIKLKKSFTSSNAKIASFSTFNVQNLTLMMQEGGRELNVHCDMAKGAEDKNCTVMMSNETGILLRKCFSTSGKDATCELSGLALGKYTILGYDREWEETPAVEHPFFFTKELSKELTNIPPTTRTDDTTTLGSSSSRHEDEEAGKNGLIVGIVATVTFFLAVGLVSFIFAFVFRKFHRKRRRNIVEEYSPGDLGTAPTEVYFYPRAEENAYAERSIPQQQDTLTESTVVQEQAYAEAQPPPLGNVYDEHSLPWQQNALDESTDQQEPAYADAQAVIRTTATSNNSHNQYREHRKEWLEHLHLEERTSPNTPSFSHTPYAVIL